MASVLSHCYRDVKAWYCQRFLKQFDLPWMKTKELDIINEVLVNLKPKNCFEWGSGYSTSYFPRLVSSIENWYSVEHNRNWYNTIRDTIHDKRIRLTYVGPDPCSDAVGKPRNCDKFRSYIESVESMGKEPDFILIDGRARKECLKKAFEIIKDDGIVILHDANRERYRQGIPPFTWSVLFTDHRKTRGGIWIGSKKRDINSVLRVGVHKRVWRLHYIFARLLFKS